ncbi:U2 snRNP auxilliary factor, large subunit, splicing factor subfamily protein [Besnoitia besnoiti]|uniref:Splicing factor U2AF subunit n=1 Tax=Besnoitia besnoiti TaxID=94643 RepID=A0A2A9MF21_BESBE|nr:U2 snRNP auxilliary factor, large subunit, splicing factor subfamily protein [Besnoitia besnoiti]PFH35804.1 U2 snRNP auxilliary factor, large subunit, splicing factor subfamily protein [Besnoitia besnoiti]
MVCSIWRTLFYVRTACGSPVSICSRIQQHTPPAPLGVAGRSRSAERSKVRSSKWDIRVAPSPASPTLSSTSSAFAMPTLKDTPRTVYTGPLVLGAAQEQAAAASAAAAAISNTLNSRLMPPPPSAPPPPSTLAAASQPPASGPAPASAAPSAVPLRLNDFDTDRRQRRLYVGNLPPGSTQPDVVGFFNGALLAVNAQTNFVQDDQNGATSGEKMLPVERCEVFNESSRFCFVELRTVAYTILAIRLDGINYNGFSLRVGRPHDYVPPAGGDPADHAYIPLLDDAKKMKREKKETPARPDSGPDNKIYIQNLPPEMGEEQVRDLLEQFGTLRVLNLIKNVQTGQHKGYGFFEYEDPEVTDQAILALNGFVCGANILSVQRANFSATVVTRDVHRMMPVTNLPNSMTQKLLSDPLVAVQVQAARKIGERPSKVVQLLNCVYQEDLIDPKEYEAIYEDIKQEAEKYGALEEVLVPRPNEDLSYRQGVGKVFLRYNDVTAARKAQLMLNGRKFDANRVVCAAFFPEDKFAEGRYTLT